MSHESKDPLVAQLAPDIVSESVVDDFFSYLGTEQEPTDAESLVESLRPRELTPTELCDTANELLDQVGERTLVNGVKSFVTRKAWRVDQAHGSFYARIGRPVATEDDKLVLPSFILTTTPEFEVIETPNGKYSEFFFDYNGHGTQLLNGPDAPTPNGYTGNRPGHLRLAQDIIQNLQAQYKQESPSTVLPTQAQTLVSNAWEHTKNRAPTKRSRLGLGIVAASILLLASTAGVVIAESSSSSSQAHVDAPQSGLKNPVCNTSGVCVEGPGTPLDSIPLAPLASINKIPVDTSYATAFGKIATNGTETLNPAHIIQTQQGIYGYEYPAQTTKLPGDGSCTFIEGNFNQGISTLFATSTKLADALHVKVLDTSTLELCKIPGAPKTAVGTLYVVRGAS